MQSLPWQNTTILCLLPAICIHIYVYTKTCRALGLLYVSHCFHLIPRAFQCPVIKCPIPQCSARYSISTYFLEEHWLRWCVVIL
uniref:Putative secreted peptide n=1 Tax=Rhipicephalus pulchellus TaxID=72859 RepID=L7MA29_RHIPC